MDYRLLSKKLGKTAALEVVVSIQERCFASVMRKPISFFHQHQSGKLVSRVTGDTEAFGNLIQLIMSFIGDILLVFMLLLVLFLIHPAMAFMVVIFIPLIMGSALLFRAIARRASARLFHMQAEVNAHLKESIAGIAITNHFCKEGYMSQQFSLMNKSMYRVNFAQGKIYSSILPVMGILTSLGVSAVVYFGSFQVLEAHLSFGEMYLFVQVIQMISMPVSSLSSFYSQLQEGIAATERILLLLDAKEEDIQNSSAQQLPSTSGDIWLNNIDLSYVSGKPALKGISLHIKKGENIALVGQTGSGKSSIARLIMRFFEHQAGDIKVGQQEIRKMDLVNWRRKIGYLPQTPFLRAGSVKENIKYGNPKATDEDINRAVQAIGNGSWLSALPDGLETNVGERGSKLSIGQRQLVSLIRILVKDPEIFILDEATASMDPFTEKQIQQALHLLMKKRTSIVIAHRLSTIKQADRIVVLSEGEIVEEGDHATLMKENTYYKRLYDKYFTHQYTG
ncbi:ABC transporter ATP-binding protein [Bacillaceae bacterium SIJ1]|uniref:ABC transporter ATP-binding protein n=1 Tax=Litoribacterium kuwaitense TaxID=1398745 RepID=UPI0013EC3996|nr:ABC transporter ATP-binding protein [Litoribacterium kuwaitense]NGP46864.1 ABC transporter ATP-binding protein [Litoribacterium kuwaitense]